MMLIDDFLPEFDVWERHEIVVRAPLKEVYATARDLDISGAKLTRLLFSLRGLPAPPTISLKDFLKMRFTLLGEREGQEFVLGLVGKFWSPKGGLRKLSAAGFREFAENGYAKAAWNFFLQEQADGSVVLSTETRVHCTDRQSRRRFRLYWAVIGGFSGLIRNEMLRSIKQNAEKLMIIKTESDNEMGL